MRTILEVKAVQNWLENHPQANPGQYCRKNQSPCPDIEPAVMSFQDDEGNDAANIGTGIVTTQGILNSPIAKTKDKEQGPERKSPCRPEEGIPEQNIDCQQD